MSLPSFLCTVFLAIAAAAVAFTGFRQGRVNRTLRTKAIALQAEALPLATLQEKHDAVRRLELSPETLPVVDESQIEAQQLRTEIERLKADIALAPKSVRPINHSPLSRSQETLTTLLEAARIGSTHRISELITVQPGDLAEAEYLFSRLPPETREQHGSARQVIASLVALTLSPGSQKGGRASISRTEFFSNTNSVTCRVIPAATPATPEPVPVVCVFHRVNNDWLLAVPPEIMASYRKIMLEAGGLGRNALNK